MTAPLNTASLVSELRKAILRATADELNGQPNGNIITKGCEAAEYVDPDDATGAFVDSIVDEVVSFIETATRQRALKNQPLQRELHRPRRARDIAVHDLLRRSAGREASGSKEAFQGRGRSPRKTDCAVADGSGGDRTRHQFGASRVVQPEFVRLPQAERLKSRRRRRQ